jgi:hypothetical protein
MNKQLSRQTRRSHPASAKVQTKRGPTKAGIRKRIGSTALANKSNRIRQPSPTKARVQKRVRLVNQNHGIGNNDPAAHTDRAAPEQASIYQPHTKKQSLMRHEETRAPGNAGSNPTRTWLDWSERAMAANLRTTEDFLRCRSPMDFWAVSSRFALRSWFGP